MFLSESWLDSSLSCHYSHAGQSFTLYIGLCPSMPFCQKMFLYTLTIDQALMCMRELVFFFCLFLNQKQKTKKKTECLPSEMF